MKKIILLTPIFYIFIAWLIFAFPYFGKGLVPYASRYQVNFFPPWNQYREFMGPVKNNAMPDIHSQIYPWKKFTIDTYKIGQIPFWNPYSFSGNPHLANFQTAIFSPLNTLFFLLPFIDAWSILILLQPLFAGIFMYLLMREYKIDIWGSVLASISFMFCGFMVVWMAYGTLGYAILYLPLALFAIEKYIRTKSSKFLFLFALTFPLSFFSGHFQTSIYFAGFTFFYTIWCGWREKDKHLFLKLFAFLAAGVIVSLPQVLPAVEFYKYSVRSESYIKGGGIPVQYLITTIAPDFFGNPVTRNDWFGFYAEWASFTGVIALFFAGVGFFTRQKNRKVFLFALCIVLLLVVDSPVQKLLGDLHIPVLSTSNPSRIVVIYSFIISIMAGFGLDSFINARNTRSVHRVSIGMSVFTLGLWIFLFLLHPLPADKLIIAKRNLLLPTILFFTAIGTLNIFTLTSIKKAGVYIAILVVLLATFDSLRYVQKWMPFEPKDLVYPSLPVINAMQRNIGYGRVFGNLGGEVSVFYHLPSVEGYDPLYIQRYGEFIQTAIDGKAHQPERSVVKLSRTSSYTDRALDLLGVSIIYHPRADTNQSWAYPVWNKSDRYELIYQDDKFQLFKNNKVLPRVSLFTDYEVLTDKNKILSQLYNPQFDIYNSVILEENPHIQKGGSGEKNATIQIYTPNYIKIAISTQSEAVLMLSDNYYPGWEAIIYQGNKESLAKIYRANYTFRAVRIPKGDSVVEFVYKPLGI